MRRSNHENIDVLMLIGLVTGEEEEGEGGGGKSNSKVGTRWVRQTLGGAFPPFPYNTKRRTLNRRLVLLPVVAAVLH